MPLVNDKVIIIEIVDKGEWKKDKDLQDMEDENVNGNKCEKKCVQGEC